MDDLRALIDAYNDAWNRQDLDTVASMHDDGIVFHNWTAGERVEGADAVPCAHRPHLRTQLRRSGSPAVLAGRARTSSVSEWTAHARPRTA